MKIVCTVSLISIFVFAILLMMVYIDTRRDSGELGWEERINWPELTEKEFTELYTEAMRKRLPEAEVTVVGDKELSVKFPLRESEFKCYLDNAWNECRRNSEKRAEVCNYYIDNFLKSLDSSDRLMSVQDVNSIIPVIKSIEFIEQFPGQKDGTRPVFAEHLAADIWVTYVVNLDGGMSFLDEDEVSDLNKRIRDLRSLSVSNLKKILPEIRLYGKGPVYLITADGNFDASLLLLDKLWQMQAKTVEGDIVAAVPCRSMLLFTGSESAEGIQELRRVVEKIYEEESYLISKSLMIRKDDRWKSFEGNE